MLFVGIDIAKNKHDMAVIDSDGTIILKNLTFANSKEGFDKCHTKLMELVSLHTSDISIAFEDTGPSFFFTQILPQSIQLQSPSHQEIRRSSNASKNKN